MTPGDRPGIPLAAEPVEFFHPLVAGDTDPVTAVGDEPPLLEEEPALWPEVNSPASR